MRVATVLVVLLGLTTCLWAEGADDFMTKWPEARKQAVKDKAHPKAIFVHFYDKSSKYCEDMEAKTFRDKQVAKALGDFVCVKLDCTEPANGPIPDEVNANNALFRRLGGRGFPFLVIVTADGVVLNSVEEFVEAKELLRNFETARTGLKEYQQFMAYARNPKTDKEGYDFHLKSLVFYQKFRHTEKAEDAANNILKLDPKNDKGDHVLAKLVLLQFSMENADKTEPLMDDIVKLDPLNEKGAYEKAILLQMYNEYYEFRLKRKEDPGEAKAYLEQIVRRAMKVIDIEHRVSDSGKSKLYYMASQASLQLTEFDKAIEWSQRALASTKDDLEKTAMTERIAQLRALKKEWAAASEPTKDK